MHSECDHSIVSCLHTIHMGSFFLSLLQMVLPSFYWSALVRCLVKNKIFIFCNANHIDKIHPRTVCKGSERE